MIIAWTKGKGGIGNTRVDSATGSRLASKGKRVLQIDIDPQCNLTNLFVLDDLKEDFKNPDNTIYNTFRHNQSIPVYKTDINNLFLAPSHVNLYTVSEEVNDSNWHLWFKTHLDNIKDKFDYVFIDTPAFLGAGLTQSAYIASDYLQLVIAPNQNEIDGIDLVIRLMEDLNTKYNSNTNILSCVLNKADIQKYDKDGKEVWDRATRETIEQLSNHPVIKNIFCKSVIRYSPSESSATFKNLDSFTYDENSLFSIGIKDFVKEIFKVY